MTYFTTKHSFMINVFPTGKGLANEVTFLMSYRSVTVNSKSFVGRNFLQIKWKFELIYAL